MARNSPSRTRRFHVLHVVHNWRLAGGVELKTIELARGLSRHFATSAVYPKLYTYAPSNKPVRVESPRSVKVYEIALDFRRTRDFLNIFPIRSFDSLSEAKFTEFLKLGGFDLIHFHHLGGWGTLRLPLIAKRLSIKTILSFYDYFLNCPDFNLVLPQGLKCQKARASTDDSTCSLCLQNKWLRFGALTPPPSMIESYLDERTAIVDQVIGSVDAITVCSRFVKDLITRGFGADLGAKTLIIPRGSQPQPKKQPIDYYGPPLRVGFVGNFTKLKGSENFLRVARKLTGKGMSFRIIGAIESLELQTKCTEAEIKLSGLYDLKRLPELVKLIDVAVVLSTWDETFCNVLTELQQLQVPVIATRVGAIPERIVHGSTGFLVPPDDSDILAACLIELAQHPERLKNVRRNLKSFRPFTVDQAVDAHRVLYQTLLTKSGKLARPIARKIHHHSETRVFQSAGV